VQSKRCALARLRYRGEIMKTKILLWGVVSVLRAGIAADADLLPNSESPQTITWSEGTKLTLLGTTYGSHRIAPTQERLETGYWI
jgi:hypothetical protein